MVGGIVIQFADATAVRSRYNPTMTVEQFKNVHRAEPFRPFTVHMGDRRSFRVDHPEFLSRSQSGRTIVVHHPDEAFSVLDMLLVTELEVHPPADSSREAAA
jgi:hypothetical protein